jgi:hypothetical protein
MIEMQHLIAAQLLRPWSLRWRALCTVLIAFGAALYIHLGCPPTREPTVAAFSRIVGGGLVLFLVLALVTWRIRRAFVFCIVSLIVASVLVWGLNHDGNSVINANHTGCYDPTAPKLPHR